MIKVPSKSIEIERKIPNHQSLYINYLSAWEGTGCLTVIFFCVINSRDFLKEHIAWESRSTNLPSCYWIYQYTIPPSSMPTSPTRNPKLNPLPLKLPHKSLYKPPPPPPKKKIIIALFFTGFPEKKWRSPNSGSNKKFNFFQATMGIFGPRWGGDGMGSPWDLRGDGPVFITSCLCLRVVAGMAFSFQSTAGQLTFSRVWRKGGGVP